MRILDFIISKQNIECDPRCDFSGIASGTRGYLLARFQFSADWKGCKKVAVFSCRGNEFPTAIINGMCLIPSEALIGSEVSVRVVGKRENYRITTGATSFAQTEGVFE